MPVDKDAIENGVAARLALPTLVVRGGFSPAQDSAASEAFNAVLPFGESADINECDLELASDRNEALLGQLLEFIERRQPREAMERSEEHTSELQSLMRTSYAIFCLKKKEHRYLQQR